MRETFPREHRVCRRSEYLSIQAQGIRVASSHYIFIISENTLGKERLGLIISKKVGNAVARNRAKRLLREVFRRNQACFPPGCDTVVIGKKGANQLTYEQALREIVSVKLVEKCRRSARKSRNASA